MARMGPGWAWKRMLGHGQLGLEEETACWLPPSKKKQNKPYYLYKNI
jgi:hypothetical protein